MSQTSVDRTPEAARAALRDVYKIFLEGTDDDVLKAIVTEALVEEVLGIAWRHQFDEDRTQTQRTLQELVSDRVSELENEGRLK